MEKTVLTMGVDAFVSFDLIKKAAAHKRLSFCEATLDAYSEPIKVYALDDKLLAALAKQGIKRQDRPDCRNEIFTLVDENPQKEVPGWMPSNYWNFKLLENKKQFDLCVTLSVGFEINLKKRGIVCWPQAHGTFVSAGDQLPKSRMFKILTDSDVNAPAIAKELAASDGSIIVTWTDLGLGGIRKIEDLFAEFVGSNKTVERLAVNHDVFDPDPRSPHQQSGNKLFIAELAQPKIFQVWRTQLEDYRNRLILN